MSLLSFVFVKKKVSFNVECFCFLFGSGETLEILTDLSLSLFFLGNSVSFVLKS